jgi:hypothetical protein
MVSEPIHEFLSFTVKDADQNSGTFVWLCRYKMKNKAAQLKKGTVVLIR